MLRLRSGLGLLIITLIMAGCSGGGGGDTPPPTTNRNLSGTVAKGAPIASTTIEVRDTNGVIKTATTDAYGKYEIDLTGTTEPWILRVLVPLSSPAKYLYSYADTAGVCNIHPLTDPIIRAWFSVNNQLMDDVDGVFDDTAVPMVLPTASEIKVVKAVVTQVVENLLTTAGITNPESFDLFTTPFEANQTGFDQVLDGASVTLTGTVINVGVVAGSEIETAIESSGGIVSDTTLDAGIIDFVAIDTDTTPPAAPTNLQALLVSDSQALLTWNANDSADAAMGYHVYRDGSKVGTVTSTAYITAGLVASTTYEYTVKAFDASQNLSAASTAATVTTPDPATVADTTAPTAPGTPGAASIGLKQLALSWTASTDDTGVVGYRIFRDTVKIATVLGTTFTDYGLNPGTSYSYKIRAFDAAGNLQDSLAASLTTLSPITAPTTLAASAVAGTINKIDVSWGAVTGAAEYRLYRNGILVYGGANTNFQDAGLVAGTAYSYEVRAWVSLTNFSNPTAAAVATTIADADGDGTGADTDQCEADANKIDLGVCGCGVADTDTDGDGTADCIDECDADANKIVAGTCGCDVADTDTDSDGTLDCQETCDNDPAKTAPGQCGCGVADTDTDGDTYADCVDLFPNDSTKWGDLCPSDPDKLEPLVCGCGVAETGDTDGDGTDDCLETCPDDPAKTAPGTCGCGVADTDTDGDTYADCVDAFPTDPLKWAGTAVEIKVSEARAAMEAQNMTLAKTKFDEAYALDSTNKDALFGSAITEGIMLLENADIVSMMNSWDLYAPTVENIAYGVLANTFEVYGGNNPYCGNDPVAAGFTKLSTTQTTSPFSFAGAYSYYIITTPPFGAIDVDSVVGTAATGQTSLNSYCSNNSSGWAGNVGDGMVQTVGGASLEKNYAQFSSGSAMDSIAITTIGTATPATGSPVASLLTARSLTSTGSAAKTSDVLTELKGLLTKLPKNKPSLTTTIARAVASSLPANAKTVPEMQTIIDSTVLPALDRMITKLRAVQGASYTFTVTSAMTGGAETVSTVLDDGEFYAIDAALSGLKMFCNIMTAYNLDVNYATVESDPLGATFGNTAFFTLKSTGAAKMALALTSAREAFAKAELCYTWVFDEWGYVAVNTGSDATSYFNTTKNPNDNGIQWHDPNFQLGFTVEDDKSTRAVIDAIQLGLLGQATLNEVTASGLSTSSLTDGTSTVLLDSWQSNDPDDSFSVTFDATKFFTAPLDRSDLPSLGYNLALDPIASQANMASLHSENPWIESSVQFTSNLPDLTFNGILPGGLTALGIDAASYHSSSLVLNRQFDTWNSGVISDGTSLFIREADWMNNTYKLWAVDQTTGAVSLVAQVDGGIYGANRIAWISGLTSHNGVWWGTGNYWDASGNSQFGVFRIDLTTGVAIAADAIPMETVTYSCGMFACMSDSNPTNLTSDGTNLYLGLGIYDGTNFNAGIVKFDPTATTSIPVYPTWLVSGNDPWYNHLSYGNGYLWASDLGEGDLAQVDPSSGEVVRTWFNESGVFLNNKFWRFEDGLVIGAYTAP